MAAESQQVIIDEDLYSRQLYVLGKEAMTKMASSHVLISGMSGLGVEIAKNVSLAGIKSLTVNDHLPATWNDLSTNFFLTTEHVASSANRAVVCATRLAELNPYTQLKSSTHDMAKVELSFLDSFKTVVLVNYSMEVQLRIGDYCHSKGIYFISTESRGAFTTAFVDLGESFEVIDGNGEEPLNGLVADLSNDGVVTLPPKVRHGLESGSAVKLSNIQGFSSIDPNKPWKVKVLSPHIFKLVEAETNPFVGKFIAGTATWTEVKIPFHLKYESLSSQLSKVPEFVMNDFMKLDAPQVWFAIRAVHNFASQNNHTYPRPWCEEDFSKVLSIAKSMDTHGLEIEEQLLRQICFTFSGSLVGLTAFMGGLLGQEVLKSLSGKFTPLRQWIAVDAREVIPSVKSGEFEIEHFKARGDRIDGQAIVIGRPVCEELGGLKIFMIGSGAIGCEMLKNFAMMGIGVKSSSNSESIGDGKIIVTDNDLIEKSNLNRQFLFRKDNIGESKSLAAGRAITKMNPALVVESQQHKVGPDTEKIYTNHFWRSLDLVVNALDNIPARLYVDSKCVENQRPLVESGTMGTKGHVQVIVPHITTNYGSTRDPPEPGIPLCTLKSFPTQIEHTIQWARDKWTTLFSLKPEEAKGILNDANGGSGNESSSSQASQPTENSISTLIGRIRTKKPAKKDFKHVLALFTGMPLTFNDCIYQARRKFETYFVNSIKQLLHVYPPDAKNEDGTPFWALPRRPPKQVEFDSNDHDHLDFIIYTSLLYAKAYRIENVPDLKDRKWFAQQADQVKLPAFQVKDGKHIETNEAITKENASSTASQNENAADHTNKWMEGEFESSLAALETALKSKISVIPFADEFEKDVDSNHHIDFVNAASNLRAAQYCIEKVDRMKTKFIAGKIIPAMATSTAAITALASVELIKLTKKEKNIEKFKNAWMNLALPSLLTSEPEACEVTKINDDVSVTIWDRWEVKQGDLALGQLLTHLKREYKLVPTAIIQNTSLIYATILGGKQLLPKRMSSLLNRPEDADFVDLTVSFETTDGKEVKTPQVRYYFELDSDSDESDGSEESEGEAKEE